MFQFYQINMWNLENHWWSSAADLLPHIPPYFRESLCVKVKAGACREVLSGPVRRRPVLVPIKAFICAVRWVGAEATEGVKPEPVSTKTSSSLHSWSLITGLWRLWCQSANKTGGNEPLWTAGWRTDVCRRWYQEGAPTRSLLSCQMWNLFVWKCIISVSMEVKPADARTTWSEAQVQASEGGASC